MMILDPITRFLEYHETELVPYADPRTKNWLLLNESPKYVWALSILYLAMVLFGPKFMKERKPLKLDGFMIFYNLSLVLLSLYMVIEIIASSLSAGYKFGCDYYGEKSWHNPLEYRVASVLWLYFFSKSIEFTDTALMILRKKFDQVTFLHVFHHVSMLNIWWYVMMFIPGGCSVFSSSLNSLVHVVMYAYYGLSVIPGLRPYLWWKKYITMMQLIQFFIIWIHTTMTLVTPCDFPYWGKVMLFGYVIVLITLFSNFYLHAYIKGRRLRHLKMKEEKEAAAAAATSNSSNQTINGSTAASGNSASVFSSGEDKSTSNGGSGLITDGGGSSNNNGIIRRARNGQN